jgi:hypothetical protein
LISISSEERGAAASPTPCPSLYLSSINSTCNLDLIIIVGIVRLFAIDLIIIGNPSMNNEKTVLIQEQAAVAANTQIY